MTAYVGQPSKVRDKKGSEIASPSGEYPDQERTASGLGDTDEGDHDEDHRKEEEQAAENDVGEEGQDEIGDRTHLPVREVGPEIEESYTLPQLDGYGDVHRLRNGGVSTYLDKGDSEAAKFAMG